MYVRVRATLALEHHLIPGPVRGICSATDLYKRGRHEIGAVLPLRT